MNQVILAYPVLETIREKRDLFQVFPFNETRLLGLRLRAEVYHGTEFPHSLGREPAPVCGRPCGSPGCAESTDL